VSRQPPCAKRGRERERERQHRQPPHSRRVDRVGLRSLAAVEKAAGCYELAVEMHSKLGSFLECAMAYKEAGSMFEKADRPNGAAIALAPLLSHRAWQHEAVGAGCCYPPPPRPLPIS
jgi:hypothetical protein